MFSVLQGIKYLTITCIIPDNWLLVINSFGSICQKYFDCFDEMNKSIDNYCRGQQKTEEKSFNRAHMCIYHLASAFSRCSQQPGLSRVSRRRKYTCFINCFIISVFKLRINLIRSHKNFLS